MLCAYTVQSEKNNDCTCRCSNMGCENVNVFWPVNIVLSLADIISSNQPPSQQGLQGLVTAQVLQV